MKPSQLFRRVLLKRLILSLACLSLVSTFSTGSYFLATSPTSKRLSSGARKSATVRASNSKAVSTKSSREKTASRSKKKRRQVVRGQRTIEPSRVTEIQSALAAAGYYKSEPTGQWDESTTKAMSAYQQNNGFKTTGKPDALSLKKLGL